MLVLMWNGLARAVLFSSGENRQTDRQTNSRQTPCQPHVMACHGVS